ncbi:MAG: hypothetical protein HRT64_07945 [Erythrobacter sp.]|nr:hypothetical protein [Erythrobacter sp.]
MPVSVKSVVLDRKRDGAPAAGLKAKIGRSTSSEDEGADAPSQTNHAA